MSKFWNKRTVGIIGVILIGITIINTFLLIGYVTGFLGSEPKEEVEEEPIPITTYAIEFESDYIGYNVNTADDIYFPDDSIDIEVDVTEENVYSIGVWVVYQAVSPLGDVDIECTPPDSDIIYEVYEGDDKAAIYNFELYFCYLEKPFEWDEDCETQAYEIEAANTYANETYSMNESIGQWNFKATFQSGCLKYYIIQVEVEIWRYDIYLREKEVDEEESLE